MTDSISFLKTNFEYPLDPDDTFPGDERFNFHPDWHTINVCRCCPSLYPEDGPRLDNYNRSGSVYGITSSDNLGTDTIERYLKHLNDIKYYDAEVSKSYLVRSLRESNDVVFLVDLQQPATALPVAVIALHHSYNSEGTSRVLSLKFNAVHVMPNYRKMGLAPLLAGATGMAMSENAKSWLPENANNFHGLYLGITYEGVNQSGVICAELLEGWLSYSFSDTELEFICMDIGLGVVPHCVVELVNE
jgi:hypothetical protein